MTSLLKWGASDGVLLALLLAALAFAGFARAHAEGNELLDAWVRRAPVQTIDLSPDRYADAPAPVRRYFDYAFNGRKELRVSHVSWRERGEFLLPVGRFRVRARQTGLPDAPVYGWIGLFYKGPFPMLESRDAFNGKARVHNMRAKFFGWVKVMHTDYEAQSDIDALHSYMTLRYFSQAVLTPWALLPNEYVHWKEIDAGAAWLALSLPDFTGRYRVSFAPDGRIVKMETDGVMLEGNGLWEREVGLKLDYAEQNGFMIPTRMDYTWTLEDGALSRHYAFEVDAVTYHAQGPALERFKEVGPKRAVRFTKAVCILCESCKRLQVLDCAGCDAVGGREPPTGEPSFRFAE